MTTKPMFEIAFQHDGRALPGEPCPKFRAPRDQAKKKSAQARGASPQWVIIRCWTAHEGVGTGLEYARFGGGKSMRRMQLVIPSAILGVVFLVFTSSIHGTQAYAKKEKKGCTYCHGKVVKDQAEMVKNLKPVGTCYKDSDHSLAKCSPKK